MQDAVILAELWRGDMVESRHFGHAVIATTDAITEAWGNPNTLIYPRSSCKMIQALPLVESGAAAGLTAEHLALACASHNGAEGHTSRVAAWLSDLGLAEADLRCGPQMPRDRDAARTLHLSDHAPCQLHNNCSGKHAGFLTLNRHLGGSADYIDPDHPVQKAVRAAFEDMTEETSPGYGIDGCSAPNFACTLAGLAKAAAKMANPSKLGATRSDAAERLVQAMAAHPFLVAGEGRACTELIEASSDGTVVKTGAEGVFLAILPKQGLGIALKAQDGATRAAEAAMAALLVRTGVLARAHPAAQRRIRAEQRNRRDLLTGHVVAAEMLMQPV
ncbi:asparaginase [Halovulum sp. GXIMD14793]